MMGWKLVLHGPCSECRCLVTKCVILSISEHHASRWSRNIVDVRSSGLLRRTTLQIFTSGANLPPYECTISNDFGSNICCQVTSCLSQRDDTQPNILYLWLQHRVVQWKSCTRHKIRPEVGSNHHTPSSVTSCTPTTLPTWVSHQPCFTPSSQSSSPEISLFVFGTNSSLLHIHDRNLATACFLAALSDVLLTCLRPWMR